MKTNWSLLFLAEKTRFEARHSIHWHKKLTSIHVLFWKHLWSKREIFTFVDAKRVWAAVVFFFDRISEKLNLIFKDYTKNKCWSHREISLRTFETSFPRRQNMSCPKSFWGQNPPRNQQKLTENFEVTSYIKCFENESYFRLSQMEKALFWEENFCSETLGTNVLISKLS